MDQISTVPPGQTNEQLLVQSPLPTTAPSINDTYPDSSRRLPFKKAPIIGAIALCLVILAGVVAGVVLSQQNADNRQQAYVAPQQQQANTQVPAQPTVTGSNEPAVIEPRELSAATLPAQSELGDRSVNVATVYGKICPFGQNFEAGTIIFHSSATNTNIRTAVSAGESAYQIKLTPGQYTAFFEPSDKNFPIFAYSQYVSCGMTESCTDHGLLAISIEKDKEYGQVDLCDPQYNQAGLPPELTYENN